ncbi:hypothetical protein [Terriglobus aquaticus]|uniref:Uncharacterized protein n=1 Tax=Terriglobus aquaticus TaxID=940139 RepID=A0ABW9KLY6_9BACT|nr:hypothetical protein [Terriglobus aquaticus]
MEVSRIIAEIDAQISKLEQAKALLQGTSTTNTGRKGPRKNAGPAAPAAAKSGVKKKRNLSADARKRIAEAQKRRWAERRKEN